MLRFVSSLFSLSLLLLLPFFREAFTRRFFLQHESVMRRKIMIRADGK